MDCAREMRGMTSMASAVAPVAAMALLIDPLVSGARKPTSTDSPLRRLTSASSGGATLATRSALQTSGAIVAPASS
jgi:hypothetical protein